MLAQLMRMLFRDAGMPMEATHPGYGQGHPLPDPDGLPAGADLYPPDHYPQQGCCCQICFIRISYTGVLIMSIQYLLCLVCGGQAGLSCRQGQITPYSRQEAISEVRATMAMEHMPLDETDISRLQMYQNASATERESIRSALLQELLEEYIYGWLGDE